MLIILNAIYISNCIITLRPKTTDNGTRVRKYMETSLELKT